MGAVEIRSRMDKPFPDKEGFLTKGGRGMVDTLMRELMEDITMDDIGEKYRPIVEIIGIEKFVELSDYAKGDELYFPKVENVIAPARNRRIKAEWNGYNSKELADKYNLTVKQISNILKDVPLVGQQSIFDWMEAKEA